MAGLGCQERKRSYSQPCKSRRARARTLQRDGLQPSASRKLAWRSSTSLSSPVAKREAFRSAAATSPWARAPP